jgi:predicted dehydrogenase
MKNRQIRCGVIGAGWWATYAHIPALLAHPRAELVAIQKRDMEQARRVAAHFGVPQAFTSADDLIQSAQLDAVVVSSSPNMHYTHAKAALRQGLHVLIEKPMTLRASEARELVQLADSQNKQIVLSCPWHYTSHAQAARELIRGKALGDIRMISVLMTNPVDGLIRGTDLNPTHGKPYLNPRRGTYSDPEIAGGGQIYTQVSHVAAYLTFLTDLYPMGVFARFHNDGSQMDIYDCLLVEMSNGCLVSIASTGATAQTERTYEVRVFGTKGILFAELWQGTMRFVGLSNGEVKRYPDVAASEVYPERAPAENLVDAALSLAPNRSPGSLGLAAMELIEAACRSSRSGRSIHIEQHLAVPVHEN